MVPAALADVFEVDRIHQLVWLRVLQLQITIQLTLSTFLILCEALLKKRGLVLASRACAQLGLPARGRHLPLPLPLQVLTELAQ